MTDKNKKVALVLLSSTCLIANGVAYFISMKRLNEVKEILYELFDSSIKSYLGLRILCKVGHNIDLDKAYENYSDQYLKLSNKIEEENNNG